MLEFISNPTNQFVIALVAYFAIYSAVWLGTRSMVLGAVSAAFIPIWNLTIIATAWLGLGLKPFMPLWITGLLLIWPPVFIIVVRWQSVDTDSEGKEG